MKYIRYDIATVPDGMIFQDVINEYQISGIMVWDFRKANGHGSIPASLDPSDSCPKIVDYGMGCNK